MNQPDLILLHGALGAKTQFANLSGKLDTDFNIHIFDFFGHGTCPPEEVFSIEAFAAQLQIFIEQNQLTKPHIFGYSMGGYVALLLAASGYKNIGSIFTLATKFDWSPESAEEETKMLDPEQIKAKVPKFATMLEQRHTAAGWEWVLNSTAEMMRSLGSTPLLVEETMNRIDVPVRVSVGDIDNMVNVHETLWAKWFITDAEMMVFPATQHPLEKVDLNWLTFAIREFTHKHSAKAE